MRVSQAFREAGFAELGQHLENVVRSGMPEVLKRRLHAQDQTEQDEESEAPQAW